MCRLWVALRWLLTRWPETGADVPLECERPAVPTKGRVWNSSSLRLCCLRPPEAASTPHRQRRDRPTNVRACPLSIDAVQFPYRALLERGCCFPNVCVDADPSRSLRAPGTAS